MPPKDSLERYRQKRDFKKTPEPKGIKGAKKGFHYLIQKHAATRLHYDFRLELDGVLKSWAVTRGPSLDPHEKRLAVEVEDHPVSYGSFEGIIPKGQYGGGTVMLWDEGEWEPVGDPRKGLAAGKLVFKLHGKRLSGEWTLVRMRDREKDRHHNWLLIKHRDEIAKEGDNDKLLTKNDTSVITGRSLEKIASSSDKVWNSKTKDGKLPPKSAAKIVAVKKQVKSAGKPLPKFFTPQLATLSDTMPQGKDWVHEIKFDGYRGLAYLQNGKARIYTRTGKDWTEKFAPIARTLEKLPVDNAIFDGEIVVLNDKEVTSFNALQNALTEGHNEKLQYYVFDLLHLNGQDFRSLPLIERKEKLEPLFKKPVGPVFYSEHFIQKDETFLHRLCGLQMEGIISKRADAPYETRRSKSWLKTKCHKRQEFVIGGYTLPTHAERGVGALLLGYYEDEKFTYAGKVGTGFDNETSLSLRKKLNKLALKFMVFEKISADGKRGAHWVKPTLVCEVEFTEWTPDGHLRHPSFQGMREDKPADSITKEVSLPTAKSSKKTVTKTPPKKMKAQPAKTTSKIVAKGKTDVGGVGISHPDRIIYEGTKITKLDLAEYYDAVADHLMPHLANRPLSMVRCPEGTGEPCFFQRHIAQGQSPHLFDTGIPVKGRHEDYMMIKDAKGLITLAQWGVIELHPWNCHADKPEIPDQIIFDLDPDADLDWKHVINGAREIRERMKEFGLESFTKTTGGKGIHVVIPIARQYGFPTIKAFARAIADSMQADSPDRYLAKSSKAARKGKIFIDYLRNDLTSTAVAPYSARAREHATVAMPITWEELTPALKPVKYTIQNVPALLKKRKDPWADILKIKQKLSAQHLKALKISLE